MRHLKFHLKDEETNRDKEEVRKEKTQAVEILTHILITVSNKHVSVLGYLKSICGFNDEPATNWCDGVSHSLQMVVLLDS